MSRSDNPTNCTYIRPQLEWQPFLYVCRGTSCVIQVTGQKQLCKRDLLQKSTTHEMNVNANFHLHMHRTWERKLVLHHKVYLPIFRLTLQSGAPDMLPISSYLASSQKVLLARSGVSDSWHCTLLCWKKALGLVKLLINCSFLQPDLWPGLRE